MNQPELYSVKEIKDLLTNNERLVFVDDGIDEVLCKYSEMPDLITFIADFHAKNFQNRQIKVWDYDGPSSYDKPMLTTIGGFLNKCDPTVREDILPHLIDLQQGEIEPEFKIIDEYALNEALEQLENSDLER